MPLDDPRENLAKALRELQGFERKYSHLKELRKVNHAVRVAIQRFVLRIPEAAVVESPAK